MIFVLGWPPISEYKPGLRSYLPNLWAALYEEEPITSCLVALPRHHKNRDWLFLLTNSFKRIGVNRIIVMISSIELTQSDIDDCKDNGIEEILIIQHESMPNNAMNIISELQYTEDKKTPGIRIWLSFPSTGNYNRNVCEWKHIFPMVYSIERDPFNEPGDRPDTDFMNKTSLKPLSCVWLQSVITISNSGTIIPCPYYNLNHTLFTEHAANLKNISQIENLKVSKTHGSACMSCHKNVRYMLPDWFKKQDLQMSINKAPQLRETYRDYVRCNAETSSSEKKKSLLTDFINRVKMPDSESTHKK